LQRSIESVQMKEDATLEIKSGGELFSAKHLVLGPEFSSISQPKCVNKSIGRGIVITQGGKLKEEEESEGIKNEYGFCLHRIDNLHVIELGTTSHAVPKDYRILHISFAATPNDTHSTSPKSFIEAKLSAFVNFRNVTATMDPESSTTSGTTEESSPIPKGMERAENNRCNALYGCYFWQDLNDADANLQEMDGIHSCGVSSVNLTSQIERATTIFHEMFPDEEFLPKPIPVEVEGGGEEDATESETTDTDNPDPPHQADMQEFPHPPSGDHES